MAGKKQLKPMDYKARKELLEGYVKSILETLDEPAREGIEGTPERVARMYLDEIYCDHESIAKELSAIFTELVSARDMVILQDIPVHSLCEHHMLPYFGYAYVGYLPNGKVLGLSKVARLIAAAGRGLSIQERLTGQIADAMQNKLEPYGIMVVLKCVHTCMSIRGAEVPTARTITSCVRGIYKDSETTRNEFLSLISMQTKI